MGPLAAGRPAVLRELDKLLRDMRKLLRAPLDPLTKRTVEDAILAIRIMRGRVLRAAARPGEFQNPWQVGIFSPKERA